MLTRSCHASIVAILFPGIHVSADARPGNKRPPHICTPDYSGGPLTRWARLARQRSAIPSTGRIGRWDRVECHKHLPLGTLQVLASLVPLIAMGFTTPKPSALCRWFNNHCTRTRLPVLPVIPSRCRRRSATPGTEASLCSPLCLAHGSICVHLVAAHTTEPRTVGTHHLTPVSADCPQGHLDHPRIHLRTLPAVEPFGRLGPVVFCIIFLVCSV